LLEPVVRPVDPLPQSVKDAFYTAVGFGVLGVQRLQVQRREMRKQLRQVAGEVDQRVDPVLDDIQARLPGAPRVVVEQARVVAKSVRQSLLG
jgi:hypothetical protein